MHFMVKKGITKKLRRWTLGWRSLPIKTGLSSLPLWLKITQGTCKRKVGRTM